MVFGVAVLERPTVAKVVKNHYSKLLNLLDVELATEKVSDLDKLLF